MNWNGEECIEYFDEIDIVPPYNADNIMSVLLPGWFVMDRTKNCAAIPAGGTEYYLG